MQTSSIDIRPRAIQNKRAEEEAAKKARAEEIELNMREICAPKLGGVAVTGERYSMSA